LEAFPFTIVSEMPAGDKVPASVKGILNAEEARQAYGDGVFGGAYQVDQAIMDELLQLPWQMCCTCGVLIVESFRLLGFGICPPPSHAKTVQTLFLGCHLTCRRC
jgi:hypothetical protein